jgi:hypothetical protein
MSNEQQLATLSAQIEVLQEVNTTLKRYLEAVMTKISPQESVTLIKTEQKRLDDIKQLEKLRKNGWVRYLSARFGIDDSTSAKIIQQAESFEDFGERVQKASKVMDAGRSVIKDLEMYVGARRDFNAARNLLGEKSLRLSRKSKSRTTKKLSVVEKAS